MVNHFLYFTPSSFAVVPTVLQEIQKARHLARVVTDLSWISSLDQPLGKGECGFIDTLKCSLRNFQLISWHFGMVSVYVCTIN